MKLWPTGGLWRHPDFVKLWSAETVSQFGTQFTQLALPLVAIDVLHVSALKAPAAIAFDAVSFVGSALFIFSIRKAERKPSKDAAAPASRMRDELREGLRYVLTHPFLKNIAACTALFNFFGNLGFAVLLVFARRALGLS